MEGSRQNACGMVTLALALVVIIFVLCPRQSTKEGEENQQPIWVPEAEDAMPVVPMPVQHTGVPELVEFIGALYSLAIHNGVKNITQPFKKLEEEHPSCYEAYRDNHDRVLEKIDPSARGFMIEGMEKYESLVVGRKWPEAVTYIVRHYRPLSAEAKQSLRNAFPNVMRFAHNRLVRDFVFVMIFGLNDGYPQVFPEISLRERVSIHTHYEAMFREWDLAKYVLTMSVPSRGRTSRGEMSDESRADPAYKQAQMVFYSLSVELKEFLRKITTAVELSGAFYAGKRNGIGHTAAIADFISTIEHYYGALSGNARNELKKNVFPKIMELQKDPAFHELLKLNTVVANAFKGLLSGESEPAWCAEISC